ncbi:MAG: alpha/beta hydrolase [Brasilonema angustatum HA4187-MV1]|jgi:pimeloyl-ACP methyl ester carboxylesterase|nr:alpha/beta hydrolase [Brasilonema angustatum HA4187-MV1]
MPTIQINGINLFYDIKGVPDNESLLLIAGFIADISAWDAMMPSLVDRYQVIRFDNRGIGQSSAPDKPYSTKQMATDAVALLDYLGISKVHLIGHAMGGQIAQEMALTYSEKVTSLILLSCWAKGNDKFHALVETFGDLPSALNRQLYWRVLLPWMFTEEFYSTPGAIEQILSMFEKNPFPPTSHGIYHQSRAILDSDTSERLKDIKSPTLAMVGRKDLVTPVQFSEQLAQGIPNAEFVILEQGGHAFVVESADAVATGILNFLTKQSTQQLYFKN